MSNTKNWIEGCKKILCIGRNYVAHAKELGNEVPKVPFYFLKPTSSIITEPMPISLKPSIGTVHHEVELGVIISKKAKNIKAENALDYVSGYVLCLDLTARDIQNEAKAKGLPWSFAKGMDCFCPVSTDMIPSENIVDPQKLRLRCWVNGTVRQNSSTNLMIFPVREIIAYCSQFMTLEPGDLLLTGTPEGVGPIAPGDKISAILEKDTGDDSSIPSANPLLQFSFSVVEN